MNLKTKKALRVSLPNLQNNTEIWCIRVQGEHAWEYRTGQIHLFTDPHLAKHSGRIILQMSEAWMRKQLSLVFYIRKEMKKTLKVASR